MKLKITHKFLIFISLERALKYLLQMTKISEIALCKGISGEICRNSIT